MGYKQLDERWLLQNLPGDRDFVAELLGLFAGQGAEALSVFNSALAASQLAGVREQAHKIKGSAAALGLQAVTESMAELEKTVREGSEFPLVAPLLKRGMSLLHEVLRDIDDYVKKNN